MTSLALALSALALLHAPEAGPAPLTIMSYNLRYGTADNGPDRWELRRDRVVSLIQDHDPDIIGTQECLDFQAQYLAEHLTGYGWIGLGREEDAGGEMTAVLYRKSDLIPVESGHLWLSTTPEIPGSKSWDSSLPRIATWVKFYRRSAGEAFYYYNTHFDHRGAVAREESAKLLAARIRELHSGAFVVLTGDFNAVAESSAPWRALTTGGLQDAWVATANRKGEANTWNGFNVPSAEDARRIDWILTTAGAEILSCTIDGRHEDGRYPSDHMPVIARIVQP